MTGREIEAIRDVIDRNRNTRQVTVLLVCASKMIRKQLEASGEENRDALWALQRTRVSLVLQIALDEELPSRPPRTEPLACQKVSA